MKRFFKSGDTVLRKTEADQHNSGTIQWFNRARTSVWVWWPDSTKPKREDIKELVSPEYWHLMRRLSEPQNCNDYILLQEHIIAPLFAEDPTRTGHEFGELMSCDFTIAYERKRTLLNAAKGIEYSTIDKCSKEDIY